MYVQVTWEDLGSSLVFSEGRFKTLTKHLKPCVFVTVSSKQKSVLVCDCLERTGSPSDQLCHMSGTNLPLPCVNSSLQDSERMSLEHISRGLLVGKRGALWENPIVLSSDE